MDVRLPPHQRTFGVVPYASRRGTFPGVPNVEPEVRERLPSMPRHAAIDRQTSAMGPSLEGRSQ